jgi:hypothetical protein
MSLKSECYQAQVSRNYMVCFLKIFLFEKSLAAESILPEPNKGYEFKFFNVTSFTASRGGG